MSTAMSPERRVSERHSRRLEVRFWRRGNAQVHTGFSTNVSVSGLFLGTTQSLAPGERVRLELVEKSVGFVLEGQVARVHRVSIALRHVDQPGAGIRFLTPGELVGSLVPAMRLAVAVGAAAPLDLAYTRADSPAAAPAATESPAGGASGAPAGVEATAARPAGNGSRSVPQAPASSVPQVVPVEFPDRSAFLSVYHRDLSAGSLFISTDVPAQLQETVTIELRVPIPGGKVFRFPAQVVRRFESEAAVGTGSNVLAGVGVRFLEPERVRAELAPVLAELRR